MCVYQLYRHFKSRMVYFSFNLAKNGPIWGGGNLILKASDKKTSDQPSFLLWWPLWLYCGFSFTPHGPKPDSQYEAFLFPVLSAVFAESSVTEYQVKECTTEHKGSWLRDKRIYRYKIIKGYLELVELGCLVGFYLYSWNSKLAIMKIKLIF